MLRKKPQVVKELLGGRSKYKKGVERRKWREKGQSQKFINGKNPVKKKKTTEGKGFTEFWGDSSCISCPPGALERIHEDDESLRRG